MAIYKRGRGFELGMQDNRAGLEPGSAGLRVRRSDHSATLPPNTFVYQCTQSRFETEARTTRKWPIVPSHKSLSR